MNRFPYFIGCPVWSWAQWRGSVYSPKAPKSDWLAQYARKFNTVEGNTTFYGIPTIETVGRWATQTPDGFKFALKFPRSITHEKQLQHCQAETELFLACLDILQRADRLGPTFLQLSPQFGPNQFDHLVSYLHQLPKQYPYAVEVRHQDFFKDPFEPRLNELLRHQKIDRVIFDSRPLFSKPPSDEAERRARQRKPRVPIKSTAIANHPMIRLVGLNDISQVDTWYQEWAPIIAGWIAEGREPFVFAHTPDDTFAPQMAHRFHAEIAKHISDLPALPSLEQVEKQKTLF